MRPPVFFAFSGHLHTTPRKDMRERSAYKRGNPGQRPRALTTHQRGIAASGHTFLWRAEGKPIAAIGLHRVGRFWPILRKARRMGGQ